MFKIDPTKHVLITNSRKSIVGIAGKGDWGRYPQMMMFCVYNGGYKAIPIETRYVSEVQSIEELHTIAKNIKENMREQHISIADLEKKRRELLDTIKIIENLNVLNSRRSANYFIKKYQGECKLIENGYSIYVSFKDLHVKENTVLIPDRVEPFFINTWDDLLQFNINDIVEVRYPNNLRYQGKKVQYAVNNIFEYDFGDHKKRLALTPLNDNWGKNSIVIIDDADRFECLMIDLHPCNRRPFYGWDKKTVNIKKIGTVEELPKYRESIDFKKFLEVYEDTYVLVYGYDSKEVIGVKKGYQTWGEKIVTKRDVQVGVEFLKSDIDKIDKRISDINESMCDDEYLIKAIEEENVYEDIFIKE